MLQPAWPTSSVAASAITSKQHRPCSNFAQILSTKIRTSMINSKHGSWIFWICHLMHLMSLRCSAVVVQDVFFTCLFSEKQIRQPKAIFAIFWKRPFVRWSPWSSKFFRENAKYWRTWFLFGDPSRSLRGFDGLRPGAAMFWRHVSCFLRGRKMAGQSVLVPNW